MTEQRRILVVDDDPEVVQVIRRLLPVDLYRVIGCRNSLRAPRMAAKLWPYAILVDAHLGSSLNGFQLSAVLKQSRVTHDIPLLMMSGVYLGRTFGERAVKVGVAGYHAKADLWPQLQERLAALVKTPRVDDMRASAASDESQANGETILLADDDALWLQLTKANLLGAGYRVVSTSDPTEIQALALKHHPSCLVLDYEMPPLRATDVCRRLQQDLQTRAIPVVILTSHAEARDLALDQGADWFASKGEPPEALIRAIGRCIRRSRWITGLISKGDLTLDPVKRSVHLNQRLIATLSAERFDFLYMLASRSPGYVTHAELSKHILRRGDNIAESRALEMLATRTKKDLGDQVGGRIRHLKDLGWLIELPVLGE